MSLRHGIGVLASLPIMRSSIAQRLGRGGFWTLLGEAAARGLGLAAAIAVARRLGPTDYGAFILVQGTLTMLMAFAGLSLGHTAARYIAAHRDTEPDRIAAISGMTLRIAIASGAAAAVLLYACAPMLARDALRAPELIGSFRLVSPLLLLYAVTGALIGTIQGFEDFRSLAKLACASGVMSFLSIVGGTIIGGFPGALVGLLAAELMRGGAIVMLARRVLAARGIGLMGRADFAESRMLWHFSLPLVISATMSAPVMWLCQSMIARLPNGLAELAHYDAAQKWMTMVILIPMAASSAVGPVLANLNATDPGRYRKTAMGLAAAQLALTIVPALGVALLAPQAMSLFGASFVSAVPTLLLFMALAPIFVLKHLIWQMLTSSGSAWMALWQNIFWAAIAVVMTWWLQMDGSEGLATAMLTAYIAALGLSTCFLKLPTLTMPVPIQSRCG